MKNKWLKIINILLLFILLLPFSKVHAETWKYNRYAVNLKNILNNVPNTSNFQLNGNRYMHIEYVNGNPVLWLHQVNNGSLYYHGYCLHSGYPTIQGGTVTLHEGFSDLTSAYNNQVLTASQRELLQNIIASGYQNGEGNIVGSIINSGNLCRNKTVCQRIYVTQILIWEVTDYARTSYNSVPDVNPSTSPYNLIINATGNEALRDIYNQILADAKSLTSEGSVPSGLLKSPVTLKWNDNTSRYESEIINIGSYNYYDKGFSGGFDYDIGFGSNGVTKLDDYNLTVSDKDSNGNIQIYSDSYVPGSPNIYFKLTKGSTSSNSLSFRWFKFGGQSSGRVYQDILLGDYQKTYERSIAVQSEEGVFDFTKIDSETKKTLKGAVFELRKCGKNKTSCNSDVQTIDLRTTTSKQITLRKSGWYLLVEKTTPEGYEKMSDTYLQFKIENGRAYVVSVNSDDEIMSEGDDDSKLVAVNSAKEFYISKINGRTNKAVFGATFQIKDLKGNVLKFVNENGVFRYSTSGTITNIVDSNSSKYAISLLPAGEYILVETAVPYPYVLSSNQTERETKIKVDSNYNLYVYNYSTKKYQKTTNATVKVENFSTEVKIIKTGTRGKTLSNVVFELYDSTKTKQIAVKDMLLGKYQYITDQSNPIQLVTNTSGEITITSLPEGTYYLKEVQTNEGYSIDPANEWTKIEVKITRSSSDIVTVPISNAKGEFCFYKIDEDGNYLEGGLFKLQVYNEKTSKFEDTPLIFNKNTNQYSVDTTGKSDIYTFKTISNGQTCFENMNTKGRYRVVEIEAPEGFILPKVSEMNAEITINENGYASGSSVIINKKITVGEGAEAQAELIINISTGQERIRYILIIASLLVIITGLIILSRKISKK